MYPISGKMKSDPLISIIIPSHCAKSITNIFAFLVTS